MKYVCILGRQPAIGLAELESLYGSAAITPLTNGALLDVSETINYSRLGGTVKLAKVLTMINSTDWNQIVSYITTTLPQHLGYGPAGKLQFGLSVYGLPIKPATINRSGLEIKKIIRRNGRSVRIIPNKSSELNSAQVLHNQLTGPLGMELLVVRQGKQVILAQTIAAQDITAYAARDQARPMRDAKVGMLPPKLAQIIINFAAPKPNSTLLDPFCGTGVVLQEASLMRFTPYGTDIDERMIQYSKTNLEWLRAENTILETADACTHTWQAFDAIACETYLGRPFSAIPKPDILAEVMRDVDTIHRKFLQNVARQTQPGFRMCIAIPAWKTPQGFKHLEILANLSDLGYNSVDFVHAKQSDLIYHREGQIVGRELVTLIRK